MAESKGALIAKTMQKHAGRAKEKVINHRNYKLIIMHYKNQSNNNNNNCMNE